MGEIVAGKPALRLDIAVSLPLDLVSIMSLLYRAVPGSGLAPWLVDARRALSPALRGDLDLLHGFSGRLLYYMEEPVMRFAPLLPERREAGFEDLMAVLDELPPADYRAMVVHALQRVHRDLQTGLVPHDSTDEDDWRRFLEPALTTAEPAATLALIADPVDLKARTLGLMRGIWTEFYAADYERRLPTLRAAASAAEPAVTREFGVAYAELTGNRVPESLTDGLGEVACVAFCPSYHLGHFDSYILYPPDGIVFFGAPELLARVGAGNGATSPGPTNGTARATLAGDRTLEAFRALADANRLRILDLLGDGELYAQEIVGRLGTAQSAVSRHLAILERAGLVTVRPRRGMKYYAVDTERLAALADVLRAHGQPES